MMAAGITDAPVVTIDGPSGSGKGRVSQHLAQAYGLHLLDSGALYRLVGLVARRSKINLAATTKHESVLSNLAADFNITFQLTEDPEEPLVVTLDNQDVTRELRSDAAGVDASRVARLAGVRDSLLDLQHSFRRAPGLVADGRDMGTVVFPDAEVKIFLTASAEARAERRYKQLKDKGIDVSLHDLFLSIKARDDQDTERDVSPLMPAEDAVLIDATNADIDEVLEQIKAIVTKKLGDSLVPTP